MSEKQAVLTGLNYALNMVKSRRILNRPQAYLAAVQEMEIFLYAAIERVENDEPISMTATTCNPRHDGQLGEGRE